MKIHLFPAAEPMEQGRVSVVKEEGVEISVRKYDPALMNGKAECRNVRPTAKE